MQLETIHETQTQENWRTSPAPLELRTLLTFDVNGAMVHDVTSKTVRGQRLKRG